MSQADHAQWPAAMSSARKAWRKTRVLGSAPGKSTERRILVFPDLHIPYHDPRALALAKLVARKERATHGVAIGDWADCYAVSAHPKTPGRRVTWPEEMSAARKEWKATRALFDEAKFAAGNHEYRYERYVMANAPELFETHPSIREMIGVDKREWHPYRSHFTIGGMAFTHDLGHAGVGSLKQTLDAFGACITFGHTHRLGTHYDGNVDGSHRVAMNVGWMGDERSVDYMHQAKMRSWQKGFGWIEQRGQLSWCQAVPIIDGACVLNGHYYKV